MAIHFQHVRAGPAGAAYSQIRQRSTWPMRMAALTGVLVAVLPLLVVVLAALLAAAAVYAVCSVLARLAAVLGGAPRAGAADGARADIQRENVRVIGGS